MNYDSCYRDNLKFLTLKKRPTQTLVNGLMRKGHYLKIHNLTINFFINFFIKDLKKQDTFEKKKLHSMFKLFSAFRLFDTVLYWRGLQLKSMYQIKNFSYKHNKKKKRTSQKITYLQPKKRMHWLLMLNCKLIRAYKRTKITNFFFYYPILNYLLSSDNNNKINKLRIRMYSIQIVKCI